MFQGKVFAQQGSRRIVLFTNRAAVDAPDTVEALDRLGATIKQHFSLLLRPHCRHHGCQTLPRGLSARCGVVFTRPPKVGLAAQNSAAAPPRPPVLLGFLLRLGGPLGQVWAENSGNSSRGRRRSQASSPTCPDGDVAAPSSRPHRRSVGSRGRTIGARLWTGHYLPGERIPSDPG